MIERRDLGSWLEGPPRHPDAPAPGERLGLPATGPGSVARAGRRLVALCIDWFCALLISHAFFHGDSLATLGIFALVQVLFVATLGFSPGHRALRLRVVPLVGAAKPGAGQYTGVVRALVRTALLCLFIPAVIYDIDHRGLHDKAAGTVLLRG